MVESTEDFSTSEKFDAVVGRFVLMYLSDPAQALRRLAGQVHPGGIVAFQELDFSSPVLSFPRSPLYEQCIEWTTKAFGLGSELSMGLKLFGTFTQAGLGKPQVRVMARVEGGNDSPAYEYVAQTTRSLLPKMEQFGIATAEQVQIETLADRLREEVSAGGGVIVMRPVFSAWANT